jgi:hypothetical protein
MSEMSSERVKVPFEGDAVDAIEVTFRVDRDPAYSFVLDDGVVIHVRQNVKKIYRLCDRKKEDGSPIYLMFGSAETKLTIPKLADEKKVG